MDQNMVCIDCPASRTNNIAGNATVRVSNTSCVRWCGFTVALVACSPGQMVPAFVVFEEMSSKIPSKALFSLRIPAIQCHCKPKE
ncbi:hypothetical protein HPB50_014617 [Hyalomma asiaticum]|uniref:Uncharacterized protein n=1 Tax=Hyalomma asiaticum TaxID=266040 RepID=A0ACB7TIB6_HYAAI|nr:hypothetical protein HPB50_014617 [Hyalomma asiaticum]